MDVDKWELLQSADNNFISLFERGSQLFRILVDTHDYARLVLHIENIALKLFVKDAAVGDNDNAMEYRIVVCVV